MKTGDKIRIIKKGYWEIGDAFIVERIYESGFFIASHEDKTIVCEKKIRDGHILGDCFRENDEGKLFEIMGKR